MIQHGGNINQIIDDFDQKTLLIHVVAKDNAEMVKYLIDNGANINDCDVNGETVLVVSICEQIISRLLIHLICCWNMIIKNCQC